MPVTVATADTSSLRNSGASSEWMTYIWRAAAEMEFVEQARYEGRSFPIGEG